MMQDFKLPEKGLDFIFPKVLSSMITPDEKCLYLHVHGVGSENVSDNHENLRLSKETLRK